jgi:hypothetical protein
MEGNKLEDLIVNGNCNFECCIVEALCETREQSCCCYLEGFIGLTGERQMTGGSITEKARNFSHLYNVQSWDPIERAPRVKWLQREARHVFWT